MLSILLDDKKVEDIFLKGFKGNKDDFFSFIKDSFEKNKNELTLKDLQILSMKKTWDNKEDEVWDEL